MSDFPTKLYINSILTEAKNVTIDQVLRPLTKQEELDEFMSLKRVNRRIGWNITVDGVLYELPKLTITPDACYLETKD